MTTKKKVKSVKKGKKTVKRNLAPRKKVTKKVAKKAAKTKKKVTQRAKAPAKKKVTKKKKQVTRRAKAPAKKKAVRPAPARAVLKRVMPVIKPAAPVPSPGEERVGVVTHYYTHLGVAIVQLERGILREGDTVHIKGHTSDFTQKVGSMEIEHLHVREARPGQSFGLKVKEHAREHDLVYKGKIP